MLPFPYNTFREAVPHFLHLSDKEMEPWVRQKIIEFLKISPTPIELYDFLMEIAAIPVYQVGDLQVGAISDFLRAYCDVAKYFKRPVERKLAFA